MVVAVAHLYCSKNLITVLIKGYHSDVPPDTALPRNAFHLPYLSMPQCFACPSDAPNRFFMMGVSRLSLSFLQMHSVQSLSDLNIWPQQSITCSLFLHFDPLQTLFLLLFLFYFDKVHRFPRKKGWDCSICISFAELSHTAAFCVGGCFFFLLKGGGGRIVQHTITYGLHPSLLLVAWPSHNNQWHCFIIFILIHHLSRQKPNVMCHSDICSKWIITQSHLHTFVSLQVSVVVQHTTSSKKSWFCYITCKSQPTRLDYDNNKVLSVELDNWDYVCNYGNLAVICVPSIVNAELQLTET